MKVVSNLVFLLGMVFIMANFVSCNKNFGYIGSDANWKISNHHLHLPLPLHHNQFSSSFSKTKLEGGAPKPNVCAGYICSDIGNVLCDPGCFCIPVGIVYGICAGSCC